MSKKKWQRPKLVVLVRGNSSERVLASCKASGFPADPNTLDYDCVQWNEFPQPGCVNCQVNTGS